MRRDGVRRSRGPRIRRVEPRGRGHVTDEELDRIERRRERWEHRAPMTYGEAGQFYREYLDDTAALIAELRALRSTPAGSS